MNLINSSVTKLFHGSAPSGTGPSKGTPKNHLGFFTGKPQTTSSDISDSNNPLKKFGIMLLVFLAYFFSGKLGLKLAFENASATAVWAPTGIALAAFLLRGYKVWPAILAGAFLINITTTGNFPTSALIAIGNTCEGLIGAYLVNKYAGGKALFEKTTYVFRFVFLAGILSTAVSATVGVTSLALWDLASWSSYGSVWLTWWVGDAVGAFVVAPFLILWFQKKPSAGPNKNSAEAVVISIILAVVSAIIFTPVTSAAVNNYPLAFILILPFVWAAYRFNKQVVSAAAFAVCVVAIWGTLNGYGPFALPSLNESLVLLQAYISTITIMSLVFATVIEENNNSVIREKENADELKDFVENASLGLHWVGPDGKILWANKYELDMLGYTSDEYIGHNISEFHAHKDKIDNIINKLANNETIINYETQLKCKDGSLRDVLISSNVYTKNGEFIHTRCFTKDITEKKKLETELKQNEQALFEAERRRWEAFYQLLEKLPAGAYTCDKNGLITYFNEQAVKVWGRTPKLNHHDDRFCGSHRLIKGDKAINHSECRMSLALQHQKGYNGEEIIIERPDGTLIEVLEHANPIHDKSGELVGAVNVLVDISEQKKTLKALEEAYSQMEEKVIERTEALRKAQSDLIHSEKLASLGRFSAGIAHEIRNPLANISSIAQLLIRQNKDSSIERHLDHINANSNIANNIIKDLLNIASPHNINFKETDINDMLNRVCDCSEARCEKNNITISRNIQKQIPTVMLNEAKIEAAILNLVSNAIEAMPRGGHLSVSAIEDINKTDIIIAIEDTGVGIAAENMDKVLEPFFTTKHEGTGLGLSLVYHVINAHMGSISFESKMNEGTKFSIRIPRNI